MADYSKYIYSTGTRYISNCGSDENGGYTGGKAGDQTGNEWVLKAWYNRPWDCVLRYPDQNVALKLAELACAAALNDNIGYDQNERNTFWTQLQKVGYDPAKITTPCEADCSSGVIAITKAVGHLMGITALQDISATYTGNMKSAFKAAGFKVLTASKYLSGSEYLLPGDINLNESHHTAFSVSVGSKASFTPTSDTTTSGTKTIDELANEVIAGKWGNGTERQTALEAAGYDYNAVQARVNELMSSSGGSSTSATKDSSGVAFASKHEDGYSSGKKYKVTASSGLNLRYGPSSSKYGVIKALTYGTSMYYYGYYDKDSSGDKWLLVDVSGTAGWVCSKYVA